MMFLFERRSPMEAGKLESGSETRFGVGRQPREESTPEVMWIGEA